MKNEKGEISIMAIIIVIVLIVLGGVTIFMLTGENGLFVPKRNEGITKNNVEESNTIDTEKDSGNDNSTDTNNVVVDNSEQQNENNNTNGAITVPVE